MRIGFFGGLVLSLSSFGCAASPALRAAQAHDLPALAREVADEAKNGTLDAGETREIAKAVATHEVLDAKGDDGKKTLEAFGRCARVLDAAFEERSHGSDEVAALAALARLEAALLSPDDARGLATRSGVARGWLIVETRALIRPEDGLMRRSRLADGDQDVRVAALRASADAGDPGDTDGLMAAASVDPHPLARTLAVRALARTAGGERAVLALRDLWSQADEKVRQTIADAWASERNIDAGGRRELWWAAEHAHGPAAIAAAGALSRWKGEGWNEAVGVLTRSIQDGPTADRVFAIGIAPAHEPPIDKALREAVDDKDEAVAVAAAWRQLSGIGREVPEDKDRKAIVTKLLELAKSPNTRGFQAQKVLARAGVSDVLPLLEKQVELSDVQARETTGVAFVDLRAAIRAARFVADKDLGVRAAVSCAILDAPKN